MNSNTGTLDRLSQQQDQVDRYEGVAQYSRAQILAMWAAVAVPMGVLAWVVAPWLKHHIGGRDPFVEALLLCFAVGLIWELALTLLLIRREVGTLEPPRVRDALWLRQPRDPKTRRVGGRIWWWVPLFVVLSALANLLPLDPAGPQPRDLPRFIDTDRAERFFHANWAWFGMLVLVVLLSPIVEELFFRGLLLPRMRGVFGRRDWVANGVLFAVHHMQQPWSIPNSTIDGVFAQAYPTRRFQSAWMGLIPHTVPSLFIIGFVLTLVL